jgi:hypothetical protein
LKKLGIILFTYIQFIGYIQGQSLIEAKINFKSKNYPSALINYRLYLIDNPEDKNAIKKIGFCYFYSDLDKSKSIKYFKKCISYPKFDKDLLYFLTKAYIYNQEYDSAFECLEKYKLKPGKFKAEIPTLFNQINFSKNNIANPVKVIVENLGGKVNTSASEFNPFINKKEQTLVFTSNREGNKGTIGLNGAYMTDIYTNNFSGFSFTKSKNCKSLNTNFNEESTGIKDDGSYIYVTVKTGNTKQPTDLFKSKKRGSSYKKKQVLKEGLNAIKSFESSGTFNQQEDVIYFSSNRIGGSGGNDIYIMKKLPNGKWGFPENIKEINTDLDEEFPYYNSYDSTLYFSSNGLPGMGEFDLFKTKWNSINKSWSEPQNLGYPINSAYNEKTICFGRENKHAYISSIRRGGLGSYDIYRLNFETIEIKPVLYLISIKEDSSLVKIDSATIEILNLDNKIIGRYKANNSTKIFTIILQPGNYKIKISANEYESVFRKFNVSTFAYDKETIRVKYLLKKLK